MTEVAASVIERTHSSDHTAGLNMIIRSGSNSQVSEEEQDRFSSPPAYNSTTMKGMGDSNKFEDENENESTIPIPMPIPIPRSLSNVNAMDIVEEEDEEDDGDGDGMMSMNLQINNNERHDPAHEHSMDSFIDENDEVSSCASGTNNYSHPQQHHQQHLQHAGLISGRPPLQMQMNCPGSESERDDVDDVDNDDSDGEGKLIIDANGQQHLQGTRLTESDSPIAAVGGGKFSGRNSAMAAVVGGVSRSGSFGCEISSRPSSASPRGSPAGSGSGSVGSGHGGSQSTILQMMMKESRANLANGHHHHHQQQHHHQNPNSASNHQHSQDTSTHNMQQIHSSRHHHPHHQDYDSGSNNINNSRQRHHPHQNQNQQQQSLISQQHGHNGQAHGVHHGHGHAHSRTSSHARHGHQTSRIHSREPSIKSERKSQSISPLHCDVKPESLAAVAAASNLTSNLNTSIGTALLNLASLGNLASFQQSIPSSLLTSNPTTISGNNLNNLNGSNNQANSNNSHSDINRSISNILSQQQQNLSAASASAMSNLAAAAAAANHIHHHSHSSPLNLTNANNISSLTGGFSSSTNANNSVGSSSQQSQNQNNSGNGNNNNNQNNNSNNNSNNQVSLNNAANAALINSHLAQLISQQNNNFLASASSMVSAGVGVSGTNPPGSPGVATGGSMPQLILASGQIVQGIQGAQLLIPTSQGLMTQTILTIPLNQPGGGGSSSYPTTDSPHLPPHHLQLQHSSNNDHGGDRDRGGGGGQTSSGHHMGAGSHRQSHSHSHSHGQSHGHGGHGGRGHPMSPPVAPTVPPSASPDFSDHPSALPAPMSLGPHSISQQMGAHIPLIQEKLSNTGSDHHRSLNGVRNINGRRESNTITTNGGLSISTLIPQPKLSPFSDSQESDRFSDNDDSDQMVDGINLDEIKEFAKAFKLRRLSLGLTQTQVGQALSVTEGPAYSQSAICSALAWQLAQSQNQTQSHSNRTSIPQPSMFEKLDITPKSAQKIKPVLERWMKEAEDRYKNGHQNLNEFVGMEPSKKRKRRTSFTPQALEILNTHFERNTHPSGAEITTLAHQLGYEREVIRIWFCNKRQALKNTVRMMSKGPSPM